MPVYLSNEITIAATAEHLFNYVTQPWRWHEWHPSSRSARAAHSFLATGDEFEEIVEVQPLAPLPLRMVRHTTYRVTESVPSHTWEVQGKMKDGWLRIRYDLAPAGDAPELTEFHRVLEFEVTGFSRLLRPFIKRQMEQISRLALENLKQAVESEKSERSRQIETSK